MIEKLSVWIKNVTFAYVFSNKMTQKNAKIDFDILFREYYEQLFYFALRYVPDEDDCHDIVSGVFEQLWGNMSEVRQTTVRALLYTQVRNKCIDRLRHERQKLLYADYVAANSAKYIEAKEYDLQEERERIVAEVLDSIGEPTHTILVACYVDGMKYKEVAEKMKISVSTVKKHIMRALRIIREKREGQNLKKYNVVPISGCRAYNE